MRSRKELREIKKYRDYPEGSGMKRYYDSVFLPFDQYLKKYYSNPDLSTWGIWQTKYLGPAFDKSRHQEMVRNFGYVSIDKHDFEAQYATYDQLREDKRLDEESRKFIGFMAGNKFFRQHKITLKQWFNMTNWAKPSQESNDAKTINEILSYPYGLNMIKASLPHLDYWRR